MPAIHVEPAPAKLTRTLAIVGVRADGYHLLESEMVSVDLADELELSESAAGSDLVVVDEVAWSGSGGSSARRSPVEVPADPSNLVMRALAAVGRRADVRLVKRIPAGAGLGGGSADAAAVLRWAGWEDLGVAAGLGADVPFCVAGGRAVATGVGEQLEPLPFEDISFVLVTPFFGVSTPAVYRAWDELGGPHGEGRNDLEPAAIRVEPRLDWWRSFLGSAAGAPATLAGSGSSWFFECDGPAAATELAGVVVEAVAAADTRAMVAPCRTIAGKERGERA